ncbi:hypothetical protein AAG570_005493 [Ranatra chinensis]|uniref:Uncharacterized protein n=1 Tax=Ranatra chinensis TaxID=642074 RepID=A0ABD0YAG7_9HEMI
MAIRRNHDVADSMKYQQVGERGGGAATLQLFRLLVDILIGVLSSVFYVLREILHVFWPPAPKSLAGQHVLNKEQDMAEIALRGELDAGGCVAQCIGSSERCRDGATDRLCRSNYPAHWRNRFQAPKIESTGSRSDFLIRGGSASLQELARGHLKLPES